MFRSTISRSPSHAARPFRNGGKPPVRRSSTARRLCGATALAALLLALPAPVLAAPAQGPPAASGALVLDWIQGLLARLGVSSVPAAEVEVGETPSSIHQRLGSDMEPNGVLGQGGGYDGAAEETLFLGSDMEPNG